MTGSRNGLWAGLTLGAFLIAANAAYGYLAATFRYDDILREPIPVILDSFAAGGSELTFAWLVFAWSALIFVLAASLVGKALSDDHGEVVWVATVAGILSGIVQAAGLLRWVFVVPTLANAYGSAHPMQQLAIAETFNALNQYAGVAIGEHLGQMLLVAWTAGVAAACWRIGGRFRMASMIGILSIPFWLIAQTELFATVMSVPSLQLAPIAFIIWMLWILALALALALPNKKRRRT